MFLSIIFLSIVSYVISEVIIYFIEMIQLENSLKNNNYNDTYNYTYIHNNHYYYLNDPNNNISVQ